MSVAIATCRAERPACCPTEPGPAGLLMSIMVSSTDCDPGLAAGRRSDGLGRFIALRLVSCGSQVLAFSKWWSWLVGDSPGDCHSAPIVGSHIVINGQVDIPGAGRDECDRTPDAEGRRASNPADWRPYLKALNWHRQPSAITCASDAGGRLAWV